MRLYAIRLLAGRFVFCRIYHRLRGQLSGIFPERNQPELAKVRLVRNGCEVGNPSHADHMKTRGEIYPLPHQNVSEYPTA